MTDRRLAMEGARKRLAPCRAFELATIARQTPPTSPRFRPTLERLVDELIQYLDTQQPDDDLEPSLGSLHLTDQDHWSAGVIATRHDADREDVPAELGIADSDALQEMYLECALQTQGGAVPDADAQQRGCELWNRHRQGRQAPAAELGGLPAASRSLGGFAGSPSLPRT